MKSFFFALFLLLPFCLHAQTTLQQLDSNIAHPIWAANEVNKPEKLHLALPFDYSDVFVHDTIIIGVAQQNSNDDSPGHRQISQEDDMANQPKSCEMVALSAKTGKLLWDVEKFPSKYQVLFTGYGIVCILQGGIQCYNYTNGQTRWWHPTSDKVLYSTLELPFSIYNCDSLLYVYYAPAYYSSDTLSFLVMDANTGKVLKRQTKDLPKEFTTLNYVYGHYAVISNKTDMMGYDFEKGEKLWTMKTDKQGTNFSNNTLVFEETQWLHFMGDTMLCKTSVKHGDRSRPDSAFLALTDIKTGNVLKTLSVEESAEILEPLFDEKKTVLRYSFNYWIDRDTIYTYYTRRSISPPNTYHICKINIRNLNTIHIKGIKGSNNESMNFLFTDETHLFYSSADSLFIGSKTDFKAPFTKLNSIIQLNDAKQNSNYLFLSYSWNSRGRSFDGYCTNNLTILNKHNLQEKPITLTYSKLLYTDNQQGILYLADGKRGLLKVKMPK